MGPTSAALLNLILAKFDNLHRPVGEVCGGRCSGGSPPLDLVGMRAGTRACVDPGGGDGTVLVDVIRAGAFDQGADGR